MTKPFLKWVGGKRQLLTHILPLIPKDADRIIEPFMGGAAVFFGSDVTSGWLNDVNQELVNCFQVVRNHPDELIEALSAHIYDKDYYLSIRALDRQTGGLANLTEIARASRFIYLNRTGFNGMYRVNAKGQFNVPFGRYTNPTICDESTIRACSARLKKTDITCSDFEAVCAAAHSDDFIYLDPPYIPVSDTAYFTDYADGGFDMNAQLRLAQAVSELADRGVRFVLSNSATEQTEELYGQFRLLEVKAKRAINSVADRRQAVSEYIVTNI